MTQKRYLTAKEATTLLGVSATTLYAYVSRGLIRSEATSESSRERRYLAQDVQILADRKAQRRDPTLVAQDALHWGTPILDSALTLMTEHKLYYRGQDVDELARTRPFEEVAALLWIDDMASSASLFSASISHLLPYLTAAIQSPISTMQLALVEVAEHDLAAYQLTAPGVAQTGARILRLLTYALTRTVPFDANSSIATLLTRAWNIESQSDSVRLLNAALILCADHELNASSFATRVIASTEATPYAVVIGGIAAIQGFKHGGLSRRASAFLREVENAHDIGSVLREWLQRGDLIPGFGHPLYPGGDPRAKTLFNLLEQAVPDSESFNLAKNTAHEVEQATGEAPTIDFALATLERALALPPDSALALFAMGRTAGWIGHAIEQYGTKQLLRPRAKYVGKLPEI